MCQNDAFIHTPTAHNAEQARQPFVDTYTRKCTYTSVKYVNIQTFNIHIKTPAACNPQRYTHTHPYIDTYIHRHIYIYTCSSQNSF